MMMMMMDLTAFVLIQFVNTLKQKNSNGYNDKKIGE